MKIEIEETKDPYFHLNINLIIIIYFDVEKIIIINKFKSFDKEDNGAIIQIDIKIEILFDIQNVIN